jgi:hypothetical protein
VRRGRCVARRSGQRPGQRSSGGRLWQPRAKRENPCHCRGSPSGARGTRTPDLLGAIQAVRCSNPADLQGVPHTCGDSTSQNFLAFCELSSEFWHANNSTWPKPGGSPQRTPVCVPFFSTLWQSRVSRRQVELRARRVSTYRVVGDGAAERFLDRQRCDVEELRRRCRSRSSCREALDQGPGDAGVHPGHEADPQR